MKNTRRLALRRETLTELTAAEMALAGGAMAGPPLTIKATCSADDITAWSRDVAMELSIHQHCSWSCI